MYQQEHANRKLINKRIIKVKINTQSQNALTPDAPKLQLTQKVLHYIQDNSTNNTPLKTHLVIKSITLLTI